MPVQQVRPFLASWAILLATLALVQGDCSTKGSECGWLASCVNITCTCPAHLNLHNNGRDCRNASCTSVDCLQCDMPDFCTKCVNFISLSTGQCLTKCEGSAELQNGNLVCTESKDKDEDNMTIVIAVVAGVGAGALLCIIVIIAVCVYLRKTRRKINLQSQNYGDRQMETGNLKQYPVYDNNAYENDSQGVYRSNKIDPLEYVTELDRLRPHADTLMVLLSQVRNKLRAMDSSDTRVPTYKGVIHQLCRVLVLLHKKDPVVSIPSDALGLLQWAQQMLEDHREQQLSNSGGSRDLPIAQISSVDLDFHNPSNPVYATPEHSENSSLQLAVPQVVATPYSTVPIPLTPNEMEQLQQQSHHPHYGTGKRPGFATISRARAIPDGALIRALEADELITSAFSADNGNTLTSHYQTGGLRREDFQNFLINSRQKTDLHTLFDQSQGSAQQQTTSEVVSSNNQKNHNNDQTSDNSKNINHTSKKDSSESGNPYFTSTKAVLPKIATEDGTINRRQAAKKNIITNPNTLKKSASLTSKNPKYAVPNIGYFANGHYYDPNPMSNLDVEVYAPGSTYSDRSNVMSTFIGDLPRSRSASSSDPTEDGDGESENSGGDLDAFPFDLKDATEPVEV